MPNENENAEKLFGALHGFASWSHLSRAILFVTVSSAFFFAGVYSVIYLFIGQDGASLSYSKEGGIVIGLKGNQSQISYLPASEMWMDSGYDVKPGDTVDIRANGRVHLAVDRLVEGASYDDYPKYAWIGPDGDEATERYIGDKPRDENLLAPKEAYGRLLMSPVERKHNPPSVENPRPKNGIEVVGSEHTYKNTSTNTVRLFFSVNDLFMDESSSTAYLLNDEQATKRLSETRLGPQALSPLEIEQYLTNKEEIWLKLQSNKKYWDLWFADNIGGYTITIIPNSN